MNKTQNQYIKSGSFTTCTKPVLNYEKYMDVIEITIIPGIFDKIFNTGSVQAIVGPLGSVVPFN